MMNRNAEDCFEKLFEKFSKIGLQRGGGITRLAYTREEEEARRTLKELSEEEGFKVRKDQGGNLWIRKEGLDPHLPAVLVGSHLDTVPQGGAYDGALGVLAGFECICQLEKEGFPNRHPIEVVAFAGEESSRFNIATIGSKILTGKLGTGALKSIKDNEGVSVYQALKILGHDPYDLPRFAPENYKAFLELHVEQNHILDKEKLQIGIVEKIAAPTRARLELHGVEAHSGACPMGERRDALAAAAEIILAVEKAGYKEKDHQTVTTVGQCIVRPGAMNVVPGYVELLIDIRGVDKESIFRAYEEIKIVSSEIAKIRDIRLDFDLLSSECPVEMDSEIINMIETICKEKNIPYRRMNSGAGHDCMNLAPIIPTGLIFVPSKGGISHNKNEFTEFRDIYAGIEVLKEAIKVLAA
jgi:N-carbamoyl-L-amino-acid hydrolase